EAYIEVSESTGCRPSNATIWLGVARCLTEVLPINGQSRRFLEVRVPAHAPRPATKRTYQDFAFVPLRDLAMMDNAVGTAGAACQYRSNRDTLNNDREVSRTPAKWRKQPWSCIGRLGLLSFLGPPVSRAPSIS